MLDDAHAVVDGNRSGGHGRRPEEAGRIGGPPPGTPCLVLYGPDKQPLQYFALTKDAMLIGRLDAVAGTFPDIDLDEWFDRATIRKISRQHALILRLARHPDASRCVRSWATPARRSKGTWSCRKRITL